MAEDKWITNRRLTSWWIKALEEDKTRRINTHNQSKSLPVEDTLCETCKTVDFEYLLFGESSTGFHKHVNEAVCIGNLEDVHGRAVSGCPFCRDIVMPATKKLREREYPNWIANATPNQISVNLCVSEMWSATSAESPHRSNGIFVAIAFQEEDKALDNNPRAIENLGKYLFDAPVWLIDHGLSMYRLVKPSVDFGECRKWLEICCNRHDKCNQERKIGLKNPGFKLIDVRTRHIVQTGYSDALRYATLSYVWGPVSEMWKLTKSVEWTRNEQGLMQCSLPETLPQTLEDAIRVTAGLNLQYVWIDAVCIIQDDPGDVKAQIGAMYHIYCGAHVNIVAASGDSSHSGLPGVSVPRKIPSTAGVAIRKNTHIGIPRPPLHQVLRNCKWPTRAWTYQEAILPKRTLFFTETEVFFFCGTSTFKESEIEHNSREGWTDSAGEKIGNSTILLSTRDQGSPEDLCTMYKEAVKEYATRQLSFQADGLNAFHGIGTFLGGLLDCDMIYGCPKKMLVNCLVWETPFDFSIEWPKRRMLRDQSNGKDDNHLTPLFPSWAWVAWKSAVSIPLSQYYFWGSEMKILNSQCFSPISHTPKSGYEFSVTGRNGEYLNGILPVLTKMARFQIIGSEVPGVAEIFSLDGQYAGECDVRGFLDIAENEKQDTVFIQIWVVNKNGKGQSCRVMLVKLHEFPQKLDTNESVDVVQILADQCLTASPAYKDTAQGMYTRASFQKKMEGDCPPSLVVRDSAHGFTPERLFLATRLGVAHINLDHWIKSEPQDALVFLG